MQGWLTYNERDPTAPFFFFTVAFFMFTLLHAPIDAFFFFFFFILKYNLSGRFLILILKIFRFRIKIKKKLVNFKDPQIFFSLRVF